jgi:O6-methylguanine-DNA--protein-cysteine methyltransferase
MNKNEKNIVKLEEYCKEGKAANEALLTSLYKSFFKEELSNIHNKISRGEIITASTAAEEILNNPYADEVSRAAAKEMIELCQKQYKKISSAASKGGM